MPQSTIKLVSWNVNGYRAVMKKDFLASIRHLDADVLGLQETKLQDHQLTRSMREIDGYQATRTIREMHGREHIPIIALTAKASASDRDRCLTAGCNDYVSKPADVRHLVSVMLKHLGRKER